MQTKENESGDLKSAPIDPQIQARLEALGLIGYGENGQPILLSKQERLKRIIEKYKGRGGP